MVPKFKGGSDDWIDDEKSSHRNSVSGKPKNKPKARAIGLPLEDTNAVVTEVFPKQCRVKLDAPAIGAPAEILCSYKRANVIGSADIRERSPVAVGDRVKVLVSNPTTGIIEGIAERRNSLARIAPGKEGTQIHHVIAANVDTLAVVVSITQPELTPGLVDRYWIAALASSIPTILCVTKMDLETTSEALAVLEMYEGLGLPIKKLSSKTNSGVEELRSELAGKTVVFSGQSGVGKTSLLRRLLEREIGKIGDVSETSGKGKHTTSSSIMMSGPGGAHWIDTPGVKEFGLQGVAPEDLKHFFPEMNELSCVKNSCNHLTEESCEARTLARYPVYKRIYESLIAGEN